MKNDCLFWLLWELPDGQLFRVSANDHGDDRAINSDGKNSNLIVFLANFKNFTAFCLDFSIWLANIKKVLQSGSLATQPLQIF